jgi:hypothetical protein
LRGLFLQKQEKNVEQGDLIFEDNNLNRDEYPLLFALKYILDFYFGEISLNTKIDSSYIGFGINSPYFDKNIQFVIET